MSQALFSPASSSLVNLSTLESEVHDNLPVPRYLSAANDNLDVPRMRTGRLLCAADLDLIFAHSWYILTVASASALCFT